MVRVARVAAHPAPPAPPASHRARPRPGRGPPPRHQPSGAGRAEPRQGRARAAVGLPTAPPAARRCSVTPPRPAWKPGPPPHAGPHHTYPAQTNPSPPSAPSSHLAVHHKQAVQGDEDRLAHDLPDVSSRGRHARGRRTPPAPTHAGQPLGQDTAWRASSGGWGTVWVGGAQLIINPNSCRPDPRHAASPAAAGSPPPRPAPPNAPPTLHSRCAPPTRSHGVTGQQLANGTGRLLLGGAGVGKLARRNAVVQRAQPAAGRCPRQHRAVGTGDWAACLRGGGRRRAVVGLAGAPAGAIGDGGARGRGGV